MHSSRGWKVMGGFEALPMKIKDFVKADHPEHEHAPGKYT